MPRIEANVTLVLLPDTAAGALAAWAPDATGATVGADAAGLAGAAPRGWAQALSARALAPPASERKCRRFNPSAIGCYSPPSVSSIHTPVSRQIGRPVISYSVQTALAQAGWAHGQHARASTMMNVDQWTKGRLCYLPT